MSEERTTDENGTSAEESGAENCPRPDIRPALEWVCCGSGCAGCPEYWGT